MLFKSSKAIDLSSEERPKEKQRSKKAEGKKPAQPQPPPGKENVFWHRSAEKPPPKNFTPGIFFSMFFSGLNLIIIIYEV